METNEPPQDQLLVPLCFASSIVANESNIDQARKQERRVELGQRRVESDGVQEFR